jgi:ubiquinone biosynthesis protein
MGILSMARTYRSLGRLRQILTVLARHGFGELIDRMHLRHHVPGLKRSAGPAEAGTELSREEHLARRLRVVMEELGPTFVKLGQMLSGRPDLLPKPFIDELSRLREHVQPFPFDEVRRRVEQELDGNPEEVFERFDETCLASGSIAQVHAAVTAEGDSVVVKVKRPGIDKVVMTDIDLMTQLAQLVEKHVPELAVLRPATVVDEFARGIRRELDFISEATLTKRFAAGFEDDETVLVPEVFWEYTTTGVLTLRRISGVSVADVDELDRRHADKKRLARHIAEVFMRQFFVTGVFHGDPHAGNLFLCDRDVLGMLDFGLVGRLTDEMKDRLGSLMIAVVQGDVSMIVDVYIDMGIVGEETNADELRRDLHDLLDRYYGMPIKLIDSRKLFLDLMETARRHRASLPREYVLLTRAFTAVEGIVRTLDPDLDIREVAEPYARKLMMDRFSPQRIAKRSWRYFWGLIRFLDVAPAKLAELMNRMLAGKLGLSLEHKGLQSFTLELERASNRLSFSIVVAALIVGSSLIFVAKVGPIYGNVPVLGLVGYSAAAILGLWLLLAILRRGRL